MVIFENVMQLLNLFRGDRFDNESPIVGHPELGVGSAGGICGNRLRLANGIQVFAIFDAEPLPQIPEHQGAIFLHFEMTRHVLSEIGDRKALGRDP